MGIGGAELHVILSGSRMSTELRTWVAIQYKNFCLKNSLRCRFDSATCLTYPFWNFCIATQAKTLVVFQAKTQAKMVSIELPPCSSPSVGGRSSSAECSKILMSLMTFGEQKWRSRSYSVSAGAEGNCIKMGPPGKLILSKRKGLWEVLFS